jgi:hypothetical protein
MRFCSVTPPFESLLVNVRFLCLVKTLRAWPSKIFWHARRDAPIASNALFCCCIPGLCGVMFVTGKCYRSFVLRDNSTKLSVTCVRINLKGLSTIRVS